MLTYANVLLTGPFYLKDTHGDSNYFHIQISKKKKKSNYHICEKAEFDVLQGRVGGGATGLNREALRGMREVEDN